MWAGETETGTRDKVDDSDMMGWMHVFWNQEKIQSHFVAADESFSVSRYLCQAIQTPGINNVIRNMVIIGPQNLTPAETAPA